MENVYSENERHHTLSINRWRREFGKKTSMVAGWKSYRFRSQFQWDVANLYYERRWQRATTNHECTCTGCIYPNLVAGWEKAGVFDFLWQNLHHGFDKTL